MIEIYDNTISDSLQDRLLANMESNNFPWYMTQDTLGTAKPQKKEEIKEYLQFEHRFYVHDFDKKQTFSNSDTTLIDELINEIITNLNWNKCEVFRVKANLQTQFTHNKKSYYNTPHVDMDKEFHQMTCLYYVNDNDGCTFFFDDKLNITKKVESKKGRFVIFKGDILHAGQNPVKSKKRIVLNINLRNN